MTYQEIQIRSKSAIVYTQYANTSNNTSWSSAALIEQRAANAQNRVRVAHEVKTYSGKMTVGAKKRLTKAVSLLVQASPTRYIYNPVSQRKQRFKLSFITLTVSSSDRMLTAKEAHKLLLEPFLLWLRRHESVTSYVWKAELQKRGQIHYHITTDQFVMYTRIRDKWNELQAIHGLLDEYRAKHGHNNANSTDVHSVKKVNNFERYMVKYMSKSNDNDEATDGKVWDCSVNLKRHKYYTTAVTYGIERTIKYIEAAKLGDVKYFDHFAIIRLNEQNGYYLLEPDSLKEYNAHIHNVRHGIFPDKNPPPPPPPITEVKTEYVQGILI